MPSKPNWIMDGQGEIVWDREKLERFKLACESASDHYAFSFEGHLFLKSYAAYLIEYLEGQLHA